MILSRAVGVKLVLRRTAAISPLIWILQFFAVASAQTVSCWLSGVVQDPTGAGLPDIEAVLTNSQTGFGRGDKRTRSIPTRWRSSRAEDFALPVKKWLVGSVFTFIPESCSGSPGIAFGTIPELRSLLTGFPT